MPGLLNANLRLVVDAAYTGALALQSQQSPMLYSAQELLTTGTGLNQGNLILALTRTLAASANEDLDLNGTAFQDAFGANVAFTKIKALIVKAALTNTNNVIVGGATTNAVAGIFGTLTDRVNVRPDGMFALFAPDAAGYTVTPTTGDLLRITNGGAGTSVTYDIILIGS